jgi:hypothetical protein
MTADNLRNNEWKKNKNSGGFPPGSLSLEPQISSGIEVAMDAEAKLPVVDVGDSRAARRKP